MNVKLGKFGAIFTGTIVVTFAISMIFSLIKENSGDFVSFFSCILLPIGYILFASALCTVNRERSTHSGDNTDAFGFAGLLFAAVYAVFVTLVYFAQCTTLHLHGDSIHIEARAIIDYSILGSLFFNYDLLGYGFMALSTFFVGCTIHPTNTKEVWLRRLMMIHGAFFVSCLLMPMFPIFTAGTQDWIGILILEFWCAYFFPICILGFCFFKNQEKTIKTERNQK